MDCPIRKDSSCPQLPGTTVIMVSEYHTCMHAHTHTHTHRYTPASHCWLWNLPYWLETEKEQKHSSFEKTVALRLKAHLYLTTALACSFISSSVTHFCVPSTISPPQLFQSHLSLLTQSSQAVSWVFSIFPCPYARIYATFFSTWNTFISPSTYCFPLASTYPKLPMLSSPSLNASCSMKSSMILKHSYPCESDHSLLRTSCFAVPSWGSVTVDKSIATDEFCSFGQEESCNLRLSVGKIDIMIPAL